MARRFALHGVMLLDPAAQRLPARQYDRMALSLTFSGEGKDMTFDELEEFVKQARKGNVQGDRNVYAELSTSGKVKELKVQLGEGGDDY
ncbi:hypothetical protein LUR56_38605 [Streptomyces sp. MT29]|nr:hypothetical protein [Streptomyces sp. MT29]